MAVAVKHNRETTSTSLFDRLPVAILMGVLYILGSLGIIFPLLDTVWWHWLQLDRSNLLWHVLELLTGMVLGTGLIFLGLHLLGPKPQPGLKSGIFVGVVGLGLVALLTLWVGGWLEGILFSNPWFGAASPSAGAIITLVLGGVLLLGLAWYMAKASTERRLVSLEDQGWFTTTPYKRNQGTRVRRGTIIGILLLIGSGLYTMHLRLDRSASDLSVNIPFTGRVEVPQKTAGDNPDVRAAVAAAEEKFQEHLRSLREAGLEGDELPAGPAVAEFDRFRLEEINKAFKSDYVKIKDPGSSESTDNEKWIRLKNSGAPVLRDTVKAENDRREQEKEDLKKAGKDDDAALVKLIQEEPVVAATGTTSYDTRVLLPQARYSLPLVLLVLTLWFAWRVVNVPTFADFLIATEAELNKVSWATRKQLVQDTIVVLVTVVLMTIFLFGADVLWSQLLRGIGVLHQGKSPEQQASEKEVKW
jgi:preprotein translocase SecE subunit